MPDLSSPFHFLMYAALPVLLIIIIINHVRHLFDFNRKLESPLDDDKIIYEWNSHVNWYRLVESLGGVLITIAVMWLGSRGKFLDVNYLHEYLVQIFIVFIAIIYFLVYGLRDLTYCITSRGLYRFSSGKPERRKLIFSWKDIREIKPHWGGFKYWTRRERDTGFLGGLRRQNNSEVVYGGPDPAAVLYEVNKIWRHKQRR